MVQEKKRKINFQDGHHGGHLGLQIRTILAILDLQVTPMLPIKYGVKWPRITTDHPEPSIKIKFWQVITTTHLEPSMKGS